jgi:hypothetical protein
MGSHYHIRPRLPGRQIPLWVEEGQKPLEVALAFFENTPGIDVANLFVFEKF